MMTYSRRRITNKHIAQNKTSFAYLLATIYELNTKFLGGVFIAEELLATSEIVIGSNFVLSED
jgi:hypothetical protein